jgi:hypothetical protein
VANKECNSVNLKSVNQTLRSELLIPANVEIIVFWNVAVHFIEQLSTDQFYFINSR